VKLVPLPKRKKGSPAPQLIRVQLSATHAAQALNSANYDMSTTWFPCKQVISASLDECKIASWVFAKSPLTVYYFPCSRFASDSPFSGRNNCWPHRQHFGQRW
jgi:hypothetical protein